MFNMLQVDAIQACGGQKTADGKRYRTGGGILWGILKLRDPNAYKEIMKKGNEFEVSNIVACLLKQISFFVCVCVSVYISD